MNETTAEDSPQGRGGGPRKPRRWRRWSLRIALLPALCICLYFLRAWTLHPLAEHAAGWLAPRLLGYELEAAGLSGNWIGSFGLEELRLRALGSEAPLRTLRASGLSARFSLLDFLRGRDAWLHGLRGGTLEAELDLDRGEREPAGEPAPWPVLPAALPRVELDSAEIVCRLADGDSVTLEGLRLLATPAAGRSDLALSIERISLPWLAPEAVSASARLGYHAGRIEVEMVRVDGGEHVHGGYVDLSRPEQHSVAWQLQLALLGGEVLTEGTLREKRLTGGVSLRGLAVREGLETVLGPEAPALSGSLDLESRLELELDDIFAGKAEGRLTGRGLTFEGRALGELDLALQFADGVLSAEELSLVRGESSLRGSELSLPLHPVPDEGWLHALRGRIEITGADLASWIVSVPMPEGPTAEHRLDLAASIEDGLLTLGAGRLETPGGSLQLFNGSALLSGATPPEASVWEALSVTLDLGADIHDLSHFGPLFGGGDWAGSLEGGVALTWAATLLEADTALEGSGVVVAGYPLGEVLVRAETSASELRVSSFSATGQVGSLSLSGAWNYAEERCQDVVFSAQIEDPEELLPFLAPQGRLRLEGELTGPLRTPTGRVELESAEFRLGSFPLQELALRATAREGVCEVSHLRASTPYGDVETRFDVMGLRPGELPQLAFESLTLVRGESDLALVRPVAVALGGDRLQVDALTLRGSAGELILSLERTADTLDLRAQLAGLSPAPFLDFLLPEGLRFEGLDGEVEFALGAQELHVRSAGSLAALTPFDGAPTYALDWQGEFADGRALLQRLVARQGDTIAFQLSGSLPLDPAGPEVLAQGPLELRGDFELPLRFDLTGEEGLGLDGRASGSLELGGDWSEITGHVDLKSEGIRASGGDEGVRALLDDASLAGRLVLDGEWRVEELAFDSPLAGRVEARGHVALPTDIRAMIASGAASALDAPLGAEIVLEARELGWLARFTPALRRTGGLAHGKAQLSGTLGRPEWRGELFLEQGEARLSSDLPLLTTVRARIGLEGRQVTVEELVGELGASPFHLAGAVDLEGASPHLDLALEGEDLLLQRSATSRLRADTKIRISGPLEALTVSGRVGLRRSRLAHDIDLFGFTRGNARPASTGTGFQLFSLREPPLSRLRFDLAIETAEPFQFRSNLARGDMRIDLHLGGTGEVPLPTGRIFLDGLDLRLPPGIMRVPAGMVAFSEQNPFVPTLDLRGEARLMGYDVAMHASGPYHQPEVILSSSPPLANDELLLLVLTGQIPTGGSMVSSQAAQSVAVFVAQDLFRRGRGGDWDEEDSLFDRLEIVTGREVSKAGIQTAEATLEIGKGVFTESDKLYLVGELDVYEQVNFGLRVAFRFP